jgi:hypothetical protein
MYSDKGAKADGIQDTGLLSACLSEIGPPTFAARWRDVQIQPLCIGQLVTPLTQFGGIDGFYG